MIKGDGKHDQYIEFLKKGGTVSLIELIGGKESFAGNRYYELVNSIQAEYVLSIMEEIHSMPEKKDEHSVEHIKTSKVFDIMRSPDVYLWSTILLVLFLTPFTFLALLKYLSISDQGWQLYVSYTMIGGLSIAFDWSILVFTINGKKKLANIGSIFQIVFIAVHFGLISDLFTPEIQSWYN